MQGSIMHKIITSLLLCTILSTTAHINPDIINDCYYRNVFCNNDVRSPITELPEHLAEACQKSNVNPNDIHVFNEDSYNPGIAHSIGSNIMLSKIFWTLDKETQTWLFAHELSHAKHDHIGNIWELQHKVVDFQIGSSLVALAMAAAQCATKNIRTLPAIIGTVCMWSLANIAAQYAYFNKIKKMESRADLEASKAVGPEGGIKSVKAAIWERHFGTHTMWQRFHYYKELLGFCQHGSVYSRLARLEKIKKEMESQR